MKKLRAKDEFLHMYSFTQEDFDKSELSWATLEQIHQRHVSMTNELISAADFILKRFQEVPAVHSTKMRVKDPDHLLAKIIRKKLDGRTFKIDDTNYQEHITDLIGIRALHLFKDEWEPIHKFVDKNWDLAEKPTANIRAGDPVKLIEDFKKAGFEINEHEFGYRSIHYLIKFKPTKETYLAEVQVRTIFEEGWSEIDHRIRYPRQSNDAYLAQFLTIFNRLSGSADEMGTFIKELSSHLHKQDHALKERDQKLADIQDQLNKTIADLKIGDQEKQRLKKEIESLRKSSSGYTIISGRQIMNAASAYTSSPTSVFGIYGAMPAMATGKICTQCGKTFIAPAEPSWAVAFSGGDKELCHDCRKKKGTGKE